MSDDSNTDIDTRHPTRRPSGPIGAGDGRDSTAPTPTATT